MLANELRQKYLDYFQERGHIQLPGAPLIPINALGVLDESTLFTSAGMQQFMPFFLGTARAPHSRVTTVQKCVRTGDIDSVGDLSHCTFFEMLGNFSFGDYFKADVIPWTWDFITNRLGIDGDRIVVTVYKDDEEAFGVWHDVIGLSEDRIHRLEEDKNYWPASVISKGPNQPCGPCSEIFYRVAPLDQMTTTAGLTPTERYLIDDDAGRWLEIWNNVFTQFDRSEDSQGRPVLTPLPQKNNDTGAGFDRLVRVVQGVESVFETDLFEPALDRIATLAGKAYGGTMSDTDFAFRVVAEHTRAMAFCIADGILPGNEGRSYVLRRIMRRAIRFGKSVLGFEAPFLHEVAPKIIEQMGGFYTELVERRDLILGTILGEEESFRRTLDNGMRRLNDLITADETTVKAGESQGSAVKSLSGRNAFLLYDTYGFPLELTREIAEERGFLVDLTGFNEALEEQREKARRGSNIHEGLFVDNDAALAEIQRTIAPTTFLGYTDLTAEATVLAILGDGQLIPVTEAGTKVKVALNRTPFYAESGGQVGDHGTLTADGMSAFVTDTKKIGGIFLHDVTVENGTLRVGDVVVASVEDSRRRDIMRNHTATHLLQAALRQVLGSHVHQKGSEVAPERLRFDFTHTAPVTNAELMEVERIVNAEILRDVPVVVTADVPIAEAKARGAMALFGEKYGDAVRTVEIPGFSLELCGGTHLSRTSQAAQFKILTESGIGSGVRRIEAITGRAARDYVVGLEATLAQVALLFKANPRDLLVAAEKVVQQRAQLEKQLQQLKTGAVGVGSDLHTSDVNGIRLITGTIPNADGETLSALADRTEQENRPAVVLLGGVLDGKVVFSAKVSGDLVKRGVHAGNLVREVAKRTGGGGGGRPDFAQAGGKDASQLEAALAAAAELVAAQAG